MSADVDEEFYEEEKIEKSDDENEGKKSPKLLFFCKSPVRNDLLQNLVKRDKRK